eukprot:jgi/Ulvmu1/6749/UM030_0084.1
MPHARHNPVSALDHVRPLQSVALLHTCRSRTLSCTFIRPREVHCFAQQSSKYLSAIKRTLARHCHKLGLTQCQMGSTRVDDAVRVLRCGMTSLALLQWLWRL